MNDPLYKKALIIGATSGIGEGLATKLVSQGTPVVLVGRRQDRLDSIIQTLGTENAAGFSFDITKLAEIPAFAARISASHPDIDTIILNSGIQRAFDFSRPETVDLDVFDEELKTNYTSFVHLTMAFLPFLQEQRGPTNLVYISATLGIVPTLLRTGGYNASKAALHHWILVLREQLRSHDKVKVVEVFPPAVQTELHDERHQPDLQDGHKIGMPLQQFVDETYDELVKGDDQFGVGMAKATIDGWEKERVNMFHKQEKLVSDLIKQHLK